MPRYLIQISYTSAAIADLVSNPQDRAAAVRPIVENMGGRLEGLYFCFGEYDAVVLVELPDNVSAAAIAMAVGAAGAISNYKTTVLLSTEEAVDAMRRAQGSGYQPPSA